ncbi:3-deoxy-7-phosphoheptulonate synthase class II [Streptomyces sodiiphilus]|uniref:Phospho-2-dehydro-3-deoxyheptonate aldolase n=1 Tax=Streptomyces sodiiphilus TaxID=226217 RepID=A0ABN2PSN7_9ACTN
MSGLPEEDWRALRARQQPDREGPDELETVLAWLEEAPQLVYTAECDRLKDRLAAVARGEAVILHGGDGAETFARADADAVRGNLKTLLQMAVVLTYAASVPVIKVGRTAGQYAGPRTPSGQRGGRPLSSCRGGAVDVPAFTARARRREPWRMRRMYECSAMTLNLLRAFTTGGFADLRQLHDWNRGFVASSAAGRRYEELVDEIGRGLAFMRACGVTGHELAAAEFFVGHEGLLLDYEAALTRTDPESGRTYATSGHLLWIGDGARDPGGAHVEFLSRVSNPLAVALGPSATPATAVRLVDRLDPQREPGRLTFVVRAGADRIRDLLPGLVETVRSEGAQVCWVSDPMHGNTFTAATGHRTLTFETALDEVRGFMQVHRSLGTHPGGIHAELTGEDVTECVGGGNGVLPEDLPRRYVTARAPRFNHAQSLELAFLLAEMYCE